MRRTALVSRESCVGNARALRSPARPQPLRFANGILDSCKGRQHGPTTAKGHLFVTKSLSTHSENTLAEKTELDILGRLPDNLKQIVKSFALMPDTLDKFKELLIFASKLDPLPEQYHINANRVEGCVSQVWVKAALKEGLVHFQAYSDAQLTKGLAALLIQGFSGCSPEEILQVEPDFIEILCRKSSLTRSRSNGFLNMFMLMQQQALQLSSIDAKGSEACHSSAMAFH